MSVPLAGQVALYVMQRCSVLGRKACLHHDGAPAIGCLWQHAALYVRLSSPPPDSDAAIRMLQPEPGLIGGHHPGPLEACPLQMAE